MLYYIYAHCFRFFGSINQHYSDRMVLKKTNCPRVNSGNTMKKCYYAQSFQKYSAQTTHVIKFVRNIPFVNPNDGKVWEVDAAKAYFDDSGLANSGSARLFHWNGRNLEFYSLNKKFRWRLEGVVAEAVNDAELAKEPFKVTLVRRVVPVDGDVTSANRYSNVTHYYDSHNSATMVKASNTRSSRQSLLERGSEKHKEELDQRSLRRLKRRHGHNQHFRGVQRKTSRRSSMKEDTRYNELKMFFQVVYMYHGL